MANQTNQANPANRKDTKDPNRSQQGSRGGKKPDIYPPMSRQAPGDTGEYEEEEGMQPVQQSGGSQKGNTMGRAQRGNRPTAGNERSERGGFGSGTAQGPSESRFRKTGSPQQSYGEEEESEEKPEEREDE